ncbi:MAG TPA: response regulator [Oculatellaceae cyanobacterium]
MDDPNNEKSILLIVDDNPTNLGLLFEYLTNSGFKVLVALDGESTIEQVKYAKPDLILMDVMMPGIDGFETCSRLKGNPSTQDIPVIFMTALSETVDKVHGFNVGGVDYITKPIQAEEVLSRVQTHLKIRNLQKQLQQQNERLQHESKEHQQKAMKLEQVVLELQQTQAQLMQAEKISSLGRMIAGVAHEINNPVNFIYGNLECAKEYIQQLLGLLALYQQTYTNPTRQIVDQIEAIDLEFLKADLPKLLTSMKVGAERISQTVLLLRNFSRLNEAQLKLADIHEVIDSTLLILQKRLEATPSRPAIQVIKEYGNLPKVKCYASQLNQVFMNILANAVDALEELNVERLLAPRGVKPEAIASASAQVETLGDYMQPSNLQPATPCIWICTEVKKGVSVDAKAFTLKGEPGDSGDRIVIRIADNGSGMTENVRQRLFDPFFTTKPVGSGTGLGLAISYQIVVEKHKGQLRANSEVAKGSEFVIEIPLQQSDFSNCPQLCSRQPNG